MMLRSNLKKFLRQIPLIYEINARLKATRTYRASVQLEREYAHLAEVRGVTYSKDAALEELRAHLARRRISVRRVPKGQLGIFWVGGNREQDSSGLLTALNRFGDVTYFQNVRGDYGLWYLSRDGSIGVYDREVVKCNDTCLLQQVEAKLRRGPLHVLIGQMWANFVSAEALRQVQRLGVVTVNISMDDRLPENWGSYAGIRLGSVGLCDGLDVVLTSSPECCLRYGVEGCPALFWPMASDPGLFKPYPESEKRFDVSFIGNKYGLREKVVRHLRQAGIQVEAFGSGWPNGPVRAEQSAEIFGKSRIILGMGNIGYSKDIFTLKLRDFDATMAGSLYVTHRNPDLLTLFEEGEEIECYLAIEECVRKIRYYLSHPDRRMAIAAAAAARARRDHTWDNRLHTAFEAIGLLPKHPALPRSRGENGLRSLGVDLRL